MSDHKPSPPQSRPFWPFELGLRNQKRRMGQGPRRTEKEVTEHGKYLIDRADEFQRIIEAQEASRKPNLPQLPQKVQLIIESDGLSPSDMSKLGLTFIEEREDGVLVTVAPDANLSTLITKTKSYLEEKTEKEKPRFSSVIGPLDSFRPSSFEDKTGEGLLEKLVNLNEGDTVQVEIELAGGSIESGETNRSEFQKYIRDLNVGLPEDSEYLRAGIIGHGEIVEAEYSIHRVFLPVYAIWDLLNNSKASWIISIDLLPQIEEDLIRLNDVTADAIPPLVELSDSAIRLVVVDSGIVTGHPLFRDSQGVTIIGRQKSFLPDPYSENTSDEIQGGHGTGVASVAAYGSISNYLLRNDPSNRPFFWIENGKILLPHSSIAPNGDARNPILHPNQSPKELMRSVVHYFHLPMPNTCKVFNLSVGSAPHRLKNWISNWAEEIDNLSAINDILFVISAGNFQIDEVQRAIDGNINYPTYLLDQKARLRNPAQAFSALSVGSLCENDVISFDNGSLGWQPISSINHPSPFSRTGTLFGNVVKPDVVEFGGNLAISEEQRVSRLKELSIPVANRDFIGGGLLTYHCGTSLSAPKVSNLAIKVQNQNPFASANLIRALIINSAEWPEMFTDVFKYQRNPLGATTEDIICNTLKLCGYGLPREEKALSANENCIIFTTEDYLSWSDEDKTSSKTYPGKVSFYTIRLNGEDIKKNLPSGMPIRVKVTLVYNPLVRKNYKRFYEGVEMRWDVRRVNQPVDDFKSRWMEEMEKPEDLLENEAETQKQQGRLAQYPWVLKSILNPGNMKRRGSAICDWYETQAFALPDTFDIAVTGTVAPWLMAPQAVTQHFALVVSIESLNRECPIFDLVEIRNQIQIQST